MFRQGGRDSVVSRQRGCEVSAGGASEPRAFSGECEDRCDGVSSCRASTSPLPSRYSNTQHFLYVVIVECVDHQGDVVLRGGSW